MGAQRALKSGDRVPLILKFQSGGTVEFAAPVKASAETAPVVPPR
jgi:copper(I)-binding protein